MSSGFIAEGHTPGQPATTPPEDPVAEVLAAIEALATACNRAGFVVAVESYEPTGGIAYVVMSSADVGVKEARALLVRTNPVAGQCVDCCAPATKGSWCDQCAPDTDPRPSTRGEEF